MKQQQIESSIQLSLSQIPRLRFFQNLETNLFVDAKDDKDTWRMARIQEIIGNQVAVHFDGWSHKWDLVLNLSFLC